MIVHENCYVSASLSPCQGRENPSVDIRTAQSKKRFSRSTAALGSTGSVDIIGSVFGITPMMAFKNV